MARFVWPAMAALSILIAAKGAIAGGLEDRAIEVRGFIDGVVGGIETLQIPENIEDLPQPFLEGGELNPLYIITQEKVDLGKLLFHDPALNAFTQFPQTEFTASCASCHFAEAGFRAGQMRAFGAGGRRFLDPATGKANREPVPSLLAIDLGPTVLFPRDAVDNPNVVSPSINMVAFFDALGWAGQFFQPVPDDMPTVTFQARAAMDSHRMDVDEIRLIPGYLPLFQAAYPELADEPVDVLIDRFQTLRAIAAYERTVVSNHSRWDAFLGGDNVALTFAELNGAELFFGDAGCVACHTGPALGSTTYHALGVAEHPAMPEGEHDMGRYVVTLDPADEFKFRSMTVRNLKGNGPFFHGGSAATLDDVIRYKNAAIPDQQVPTLSPLFVPLNLSEQEILDLHAYLADALQDSDMQRFVPDELPSGRCFPHDDLPSRYDAGCSDYGDFDDDGSIDAVDVAVMATCVNGPDAAMLLGCKPVDREGDEDVDLADFAAFQAEFVSLP